jgi:N-acetylated-alpha-linked acidic dipeptidase
MRVVVFAFAACAAIPVALGGFARREAPVSPPPSGPLGFSKASAGIERESEGRFTAGVSIEAMSAIHREVTRRPHLAGTQASLDVADLIRRRLNDAGLETEVHDYQVWLSTPRHIAVALTAPLQQPLTVDEPPNAADPDSADPALGPGFVGYSASGTVVAPVLYVNYGLPPDYARLRSAGLDAKGKIVLARYGHSHRAVKIHTAEEAGAAGIIIYSDPADDGYVRGLVWPDGPWRADSQLQRGNGKFSWFWHGDPLSPGFAATADAPVLDPSAVPTLPRIPAVVLASKEAAKILSRLEGPPAPSGFQGGLPFTYRLGPGAVKVKLDVQMEAGRRRIRDVIGTIRGRNPDRWVMLGTHHDAWTFGGMDPGTGVTAVYEVARDLAALKKAGWVPERSLRFAFWDAEEPGLIGSTEFAEEFQKELRQKAVAYINVDLFMRGHFNGGGTPSLRDFLAEVTQDVPSYTGTGSVYDGWRAEEWQRQSAERRKKGQTGFEVDLANLGSGADFVAFQDYLGLPTLSMQYDFEGSYGTYHSNYDTRWYLEHFVDPGFKVTACLVHVFGLSMMRLGSADILPFHYSYYAKKINDFLDGATASAIDENGERLVTLDLSKAKEIARAIAEHAGRLEARVERGLLDSSWTRDQAAGVNDQLVRVEQTLLDEQEPVQEHWYRHVVYGWNIYSLYDGQPLPGLADAVRRHDAQRIQQETARVEAALNRMATALDEVGSR